LTIVRRRRNIGRIGIDIDDIEDSLDINFVGVIVDAQDVYLERERVERKRNSCRRRRRRRSRREVRNDSMLMWPSLRPTSIPLSSSNPFVVVLEDDPLLLLDML
jgi:hypothetical protein